jgi:hypothetical protein
MIRARGCEYGDEERMEEIRAMMSTRDDEAAEFLRRWYGIDPLAVLSRLFLQYGAYPKGEERGESL